MVAFLWRTKVHQNKEHTIRIHVLSQVAFLWRAKVHQNKEYTIRIHVLYNKNSCIIVSRVLVFKGATLLSNVERKFLPWMYPFFIYVSSFFEVFPA